MNLQSAILLLLGISLIPLAGYVYRFAHDRAEARWFALGVVAASTYLMAIAMIDLAPSDRAALWATRLAYAGPSIGFPAMILLVRRILLATDASRSLSALLFLASIAAHSFALFGGSVISGIDRTTMPPSFVYGPFAIVPLSFDAGILLFLVAVVIRDWPKAPWRAQNRFLVLVVSLILWTFFTITSNLVLPILYGDNRYYLVGPALLLLPACGGAWVIAGERLPDLLAMAGRLFPNGRSRLLRKLADLEQGLLELPDIHALVSELEGVMGGRQFAYAGAGDGLSFTPGAVDFLYKPGDRQRVEKLASHYAHSPETLDENLLLTGWTEVIGFAEPVASPWPVSSAREIEVINRMTTSLAAEPVVILSATGYLDTISIKSLAKQVRRSLVFTAELVAKLDGGREDAVRLLKEERNLRDVMIVIRLAEQARAEHLETTVSACVSDGAKLLLVTAMDRNDLIGYGLFGGTDINLQEAPLFALGSPLQRASNISVHLDLILSRLEASYGTFFRLTPEERHSFCRRQWRSIQELEFELEKHLLMFRFSPSASQKGIPV
ncbi:MAG: hypothetical protein KIT79_08485 [Deltaproteobacteria bacterium]|nr:hypothetical protein [Deltaproteobacteria bacterium]